MKKKLPKNINTNVIVEHFLGGVVMQSFMPITLTGFEKKPLGEVYNYFVATKLIELPKSKVQVSFFDYKEVNIANSFELTFDTHIVFPVDILIGIAKNYEENKTDKYWYMDDVSAIKKSLQASFNTRGINQALDALHIKPEYFVGTGDSRASAMGGIDFFPDYIFSALPLSIIKNISKKHPTLAPTADNGDTDDADDEFFVGNISSINKSLFYPLQVTVYLGSKDVMVNKLVERNNIAKKYATILEKIIFEDKTYYSFMVAPPPNSKKMVIEKPKTSSREPSFSMRGRKGNEPDEF